MFKVLLLEISGGDKGGLCSFSSSVVRRRRSEELKEPDNRQCSRWGAVFPEADPVWIVEEGSVHVVRVRTCVCM